MNVRSLFVASVVFCLTCSSITLPQSSPTGTSPAVTPSVIALDLSTPRATHASVELSDGRVLLIGGCVADGCDEGPGSATVDVFEPGTRRIVPSGALAQPRVQPAAVRLPGDRALIVGGWSRGQATAAAEVFDPRTRLSRNVHRMSHARRSVAAISLTSGQVLVVGGSDGRQDLASAELFDATTERFVPAGDLQHARSAAVLSKLPDGRVLVTGGTIRGVVTPTAEIYDPATKQFSLTGSMREGRYKHAAATLRDGRILVIGGSDASDYGGKKQSLEIYDPRTRLFTSAGNLRTARFKITHSVAVLEDGRVLIAGGAPKIEVFNPAQGTVTELHVDLGESWSYMSATLVGQDEVLLVGGYSEGSIRVSRQARLIAVR
jgi:hypothetical protein